ncbi:hypothetical protein I3760_09G061000 [Carya illinoinensis]|nr:hypothetical protein I3760_09G061000 [Carya illinoinensis]
MHVWARSAVNGEERWKCSRIMTGEIGLKGTKLGLKGTWLGLKRTRLGLKGTQLGSKGTQLGLKGAKLLRTPDKRPENIGEGREYVSRRETRCPIVSSVGHTWAYSAKETVQPYLAHRFMLPHQKAA